MPNVIYEKKNLIDTGDLFRLFLVIYQVLFIVLYITLKSLVSSSNSRGETKKNTCLCSRSIDEL